DTLFYHEGDGAWCDQNYSVRFSTFQGCTDPLAPNYDSTACIDNGSCLSCDLNISFTNVYPSDSILCDGASVATAISSYPIISYNWINSLGISVNTNNYFTNMCNDIYFVEIVDSVGCIVTDTLLFGSIYGCTDSSAFNYYWGATVDDGSCIPVIYGCTNPMMFNYNSLANTDDGSCISQIFGCIDTLALNFDSIANTDDGSCLYCDLANSMFIFPNTSGNCDGMIIANSVSSYPPIIYLWSDGTTQNNLVNLCTGTYSVTITDNVGCEIEDTVYIGLILGCTDPTALNYDSLATVDDGSCIPIINGCTDSTAINYYAGANVDDGSCIYSFNCLSPKPTGLFAFDIIDTRAKISWDNMNDIDCMVWKYYVRYREVGTSGWTTKSAGVGNGLCNFGLNTVTKQLLYLTPSTTYEFRMKAFYCGGTSSNYSTPVQFTTADPCPDMTNLTATTFNSNQSKVRFNWDTTGTYTFARILLRVDVPGSNWQTAGGFGVYYPTFFVNKFGLTAGENYRAQGRTFCDSNITAYRSPTWTAPIFWTQPGSIKLNGGTAINNLDVYPNPSRDVFNISFNSDKRQDLTIRILNVVAGEVYREERQEFVGEYIKQISLDNYGKGIYFLEIETSTGVVNKKLILQ
ncbi:T9SS type A sorting domain-containing protein, partial [bacterium]|nr:T9SS type A sorting domain-containing protein [bacterium]